MWLDSRYSMWPCYHTPTAFVKTNNSVEQFNKVIKWDYTLHYRVQVCSMPKKLMDMSKHKSITASPFAERVAPSKPLLARAKNLIEGNQMAVRPSQNDVLFLMGEVGGGFRDEMLARRPLSASTKSAANTPTEQNTNNTRMERLGQPVHGWHVDVSGNTCQRLCFFKFGFCVHLIAALHFKSLPVPGWPRSQRRFVNRRITRVNRAQGRPKM